jgi:hypothetical protein
MAVSSYAQAAAASLSIRVRDGAGHILFIVADYFVARTVVPTVDYIES